MPYLSQPLAEFWNNVFNVSLAVGAVLVGVATWGVFWTGSMKEFYSNERIAGANAIAGRANERAEELKTANLQLQRDVEGERVARLKLQKNVEWRTIDNDQFQKIKGYLRDQRVAVPVTLHWPNDPEATTFAFILSQCLRMAPTGNITSSVRIDPPGISPLIGIYISPGAGDPIIKVLRDNGFKVNLFNQPPDPNSVSIDVGIKPPPQLQ